MLCLAFQLLYSSIQGTDASCPASYYNADTGFIWEQHINRILIDGGSVANIKTKVVLKKLGISIDQLCKSNIARQGFNQGGQRSIGKILVGLCIGDVKSNTLIYVINAKTSYNLLLGRPWVHENRVVPSTLQQCMKYMKDGEVVKIDADINPFTKTESYFADAKFYLNSGRSNMEKHVEADSIDLEDSKVQWAAIKMSNKRTEEECTQQVHPPRKELSHTTFQGLKKKMTGPVAQVPSFTLEPSKGNTQVAQIKGNFDQTVFILFEKSGYSFSNPVKLVEEGADIDDTCDDAQEAPSHIEDGVQSTIDDLKELNLGTLENEAKKAQELHSLSRTLIGAELNYTPIEKMFLALLYAIRKLRHYFEAYTIKLISRADPIKFVMTRPVLSGRLARYSILFNQYEIIYTPQKAMKGQALANFLADHPLPGKWETSGEFPNGDAYFTEELPAWTMFFDGSARQDGAGVEDMLVSPERLILPFLFVLVTDNGTPFNNKLMSSLCEKLSFKQHKSSMYNAPANGLAEAFNKTLVQEGLTTESNVQLRLVELEALDEKRLVAQQRLSVIKLKLQSIQQECATLIISGGRLCLSSPETHNPAQTHG
ncbi:hypothetical protein KY290_007886 [Solanum tuberosum]|uniref:Integrase catalytic domain-containing protein n=1 Tax=Solanum tuberosum TaxID=4113 RepID=A0ABQ7W904_SOLTU|nr:hypothetical protein KY290_007886 [Solanum tuberosum]